MASNDHYKTLNLTRTATLQDINAAYRRLALQYHPHRNKNEGAEAIFAKVSEAYHILSHGHLRAIYDQYGTQGLVVGVPVAGSTTFSDPFVFHGDTHKIFRDFFGTDNPYQDLILPYDEAKLDKTQGQHTRRRKDADVEEDLCVSLEEVFLGCVKKMRITRRVLGDDGHSSSVQDKILSVTIQPGWKEGTRITFPNEGDQSPNNIPADVVFVLQYKGHPNFVREGDDLVYRADISLVNALTGSILELPTLDGRRLNIPLNEIVHPTFEKRVAGEGMPIPKACGQKGDLVLRFNVIFPASLSEEKKVLVRQGLTP